MTNKIWKKSNGAHMLVSALTTSLFLSLYFAIVWFGGNSPFSVEFFFFTSLAGFLIPVFLIPTEWIDNSIPDHPFWKEVLS